MPWKQDTRIHTTNLRKPANATTSQRENHLNWRARPSILIACLIAYFGNPNCELLPNRDSLTQESVPPAPTSKKSSITLHSLSSKWETYKKRATDIGSIRIQWTNSRLQRWWRCRANRKRAGTYVSMTAGSGSSGANSQKSCILSTLELCMRSTFESHEKTNVNSKFLSRNLPLNQFETRPNPKPNQMH